MTYNNLNKFYVYIHYRLDNDEPFYIGKGLNNRFKDFTRRNIYWKRIYNKYGCRAIIVEDNLTENVAFERELYYYNLFKDKYYLTNLQTCGKGGVKWLKPMSDEVRKKISIANLGEKNSNFGGRYCTKEWSELQRTSQTKYKYILTNTYTNEILIFNSFYEAGEYFGSYKFGNQIRNSSYSHYRYKRIWKVERKLINSNDL